MDGRAVEEGLGFRLWHSPSFASRRQRFNQAKARLTNYRLMDTALVVVTTGEPLSFSRPGNQLPRRCWRSYLIQLPLAEPTPPTLARPVRVARLTEAGDATLLAVAEVRRTEIQEVTDVVANAVPNADRLLWGSIA